MRLIVEPGCPLEKPPLFFQLERTKEKTNERVRFSVSGENTTQDGNCKTSEWRV